RPWQYRDDEGSRNPRALHGPHHARCSHWRVRRTQRRLAEKRQAGRRRADLAGSDGTVQAGGDDGTFPSGERHVTGHRTLLLCLLLAATPGLAREVQPVHRVNAPIAPKPRPTFLAPAAPEAPIDLSHALPGKALAKLPSSAQQLKSLSSELS